MSPSASPGPVLEPRVIPAKVRVPTPRLDVVHRPRLLDRLADTRGRVLLVSAPAGSGKTVLVLDWLRRADPPTAWLSLDALDNDPPRFHAHLAAALRSLETPASGAAAEVVEALGRRGSGWSAELGLTLAELDEGTVLVLDDVHEVEAPPLVALLEGLVTGRHGGPRLVLITRVDPPFGLGRLRVSGELTEIRQRDLRFTREEAAALLAGLVPGLDPALVDRLEERTEGWAAGLRMAAAALEASEDTTAAVEAFTGTHELMVDYLLEEAVGAQDPAVQQFLMDTSILPRFTAEACAAVTDDPGAGRHLEALDDADLFLVSLDDRRGWYRYHHLFAELLEYRLGRLHPERMETLRQRASRWFEGQGDVQEALRQAAAMDDRSRLLELLDRHGYPILLRSEFASFARWLHRVPDPLEQPWPMFLVALAWFRAQTERAPDLDRVLDAVRRALAEAPEDYPAERAAEARLHLDALLPFALRVIDRFEEAIEVGERVLEQLPDDAVRIRGIVEFNLGAVYLRLADMRRARPHLERGYDRSLQTDVPYLILASLGHLGAIAAQTEGLHVARQRLESAVTFAEQEGLDGVPAFAIVLYQLAQVHYLGDELEAARALLERAMALTRDERETDIQANVLIHLARVERARGELDRARELLTAATALAHGHNVKPFGTTLDVERARLDQVRSGRLQTPGSAPPSAESGARWSSLREAETVLQLQHCLLLGRREEARELATRLRNESEPRGRGVALCLGRLGLAAVAEDARERWRAFEAALEQAAGAGYIRPLLEGGEPVRGLLEAGLAGASLSAAGRAFVRDLLDRFGTPAAGHPGAAEATRAAPVPPDPALEELTDRERETLALLTTGMTNDEMAQKLFVSVNTVKTHLKRIYGKLDVSTRTEAAERARAMGVVPPTD